MLTTLFNPYLFAIMTAWILAQTLKIPIHFITNKEWRFDLILESGGMPSSHSTLASCTTLLIGLFEGFQSPIFALALTMTVIVIYDATHVRREAGFHAERLNLIFNDILHGHPLKEENLREVIGHTPTQVFFGIILGITIALIYYFNW